MLPPQLRREQLVQCYVAGIWGKTSHPLFHSIFESQSDEEFRQQSTRTQPLGVRAKRLMESASLEFCPVEGWGFSNSPPWLMTPACARLDLTICKKNETSPIVYRQKLFEILNYYYDHRPIFTDGSKIDNGVGCAVYTEGVTLQWTLPPYATVFTAEVYAICQALKLIIEKKYNKVLILSDSLSTLMALRDIFSADPMIININNMLHQLRTYGQRVTFAWVPGHIGVSGNEKADQAARSAASNQIQSVIPVRPTDLKAHIKENIIRKWQHQWDYVNEKLKDIEPRVQRSAAENLPRRESVIITRLRIGHTRVTHGHLLIGARRPRCSWCNERLTVAHVLEECQTLRQHRAQAGLPDDLRAVLEIGSSHKKRLFAFLKKIQLYHKI
ncbi:uncharacterized protein [Rhodnius prolixus]|uniref:uncharacterized protein n=1 Tax=Rhodnius prolixus TaxID=13249 RepID=UPI003D18C64C